MSKTKLLSFIILVSSILFFSELLSAQPAKSFRLKVLDGSTLSIEGDSTLRRYYTATRTFRLDSEVSSKIAVDITAIPMKELISGKSYSPSLGKIAFDLSVKDFHADIIGFDGHFRKAMKEPDFPTISFTMVNGTITMDSKNSDRVHVRVNGNLKIAGVEKPVSLNTVAVANGNSVTVTGSKELLMTDFNITPPTLLFVTADNKVTVKWKLNIALERR